MSRFFFLTFFIMAQFLFLSTTTGQLIHPPQSSQQADSLLYALRNGNLLVPLMMQSKKMEMLDQLRQSPRLDDREREKYAQKYSETQQEQESFNRSLIRAFREHYHFSRVYFIADSSLRFFEPDKAILLDPESLKADPAIKMKDAPYFFVQYFQTAGVATEPGQVRFLYLADSRQNTLHRPFPHSPARWVNYKMRFWDLLNLGPGLEERIDLLVTELNAQLKKDQPE